jgi:hypothetical protein
MDDQHIDVLTGNLCAIYGACMPMRVSSPGGRVDDWNVLAPALLARSHYLLESTMALRARPIDSFLLVRSLYEYVVTFAWLAIDPQNHVPRFMKWEYDERDKGMKDLANFAEVEPEWLLGLEEFRKQYVRDNVKCAPAVPDRALAAEARWSQLVSEGLPAKYGFRGMYAPVFRQASSFVHATTISAGHFVAGPWSSLVVGRPVKPKRSPVGMAPVVFGIGLLVASESLGWPNRAHVESAFALAENGTHLIASRHP